MGDYRPMLKAGQHARAMLRYICRSDSVTAEKLTAATRAFAGRLQFVSKGDAVAVDYTTGQYFPTEYRNAACAVMAQALWDHARECGYDTGDKIRKWARGEFGRSVANQWF